MIEASAISWPSDPKVKDRSTDGPAILIAD
jgi:hypothetical protein